MTKVNQSALGGQENQKENDVESQYLFYNTKQTHFCGIRNGGGAERPPPQPSIIFEGRNLPQQTINHWKGNLSKRLIHFRYRQNILILRLYEQFSRNALQRLQKNNSNF